MDFARWIEDTINGNTDAFRNLVKALESKVAMTIIGMLGNCSEADDVGQEVFLRFYRSLKKIREPEKCESFVIKIAINLSLNELKKRKRWTSIFQDRWSETDFEQKTNAIEIKETGEMVQAAIQKLDVDFRSVVVLRMLDGCSVKETADILKIPEGTVLSRLSRGQKKLQAMLKPLIGDRL